MLSLEAGAWTPPGLLLGTLSSSTLPPRSLGQGRLDSSHSKVSFLPPRCPGLSNSGCQFGLHISAPRPLRPHPSPRPWGTF